MMYADLYEYLLLHHELPLPGLGLFQVRRHPSVIDFPNRQIQGPGYSIEWQEGQQGNTEGLCNWVASHYNTSSHEAKHKLEKFIFQIKQSISDGEIIHWKGVGELRKKQGVSFGFQPEEMIREGVVSAHKVIREKAAHMVKVGEEEKTSEQMTTLLSKKKRWQVKAWQLSAIAISVLSIGFLFWYLSGHAWNINAGNQCPLELNTVKEASYILLP